jgi:hypothetical protein
MNNKLKKIGPQAKKIDFWQKIEYIKAKCARLEAILSSMNFFRIGRNFTSTGTGSEFDFFPVSGTGPEWPKMAGIPANRNRNSGETLAFIL